MAGRITKAEQQLERIPFRGQGLSRFINCIEAATRPTATRVVIALDEIQKRIDKEKSEELPKTSIELFHPRRSCPTLRRGPFEASRWCELPGPVGSTVVVSSR